MCVCVGVCVRFSAAADGIDLLRRAAVGPMAGGEGEGGGCAYDRKRFARARAAHAGHWRSSGRAFDQGRGASPSRVIPGRTYAIAV